MSGTDLDRATAIVTGVGRGFGRAITRQLLHAGAHVVGIARSGVAVGALRREYASKFVGEVADASDPSLPARLFARYSPEIAVLNAGAAPRTGPLDTQTWETFSANWHSDVRQVFNFAQASLLAPLAPGSVVVAISSTAALRGSPLTGGYAGAKATVRFISAYASTEAKARSLGLRFIAILAQLTPATNLGAAQVAAYAERAGLHPALVVDQLAGMLTTELVDKTVTEIVSDDAYSADAYALTAAGLDPL